MTSSSSNRTSLFRPCIDIHSGLVKQIVGSSLKDTATEELLTNFVATHPPSYYSNLYKQAGLTGAHVIKLGGGELNDEAAKTALNEWKDGLQVGGGMNADNARQWLENGASKVSDRNKEKRGVPNMRTDSFALMNFKTGTGRRVGMDSSKPEKSKGSC